MTVQTGPRWNSDVSPLVKSRSLLIKDGAVLIRRYTSEYNLKILKLLFRQRTGFLPTNHPLQIKVTSITYRTLILLEVHFSIDSLVYQVPSLIHDLCRYWDEQRWERVILGKGMSPALLVFRSFLDFSIIKWKD